mmetsp:Transcript_14200/g.20280  ORF Transcript_14200/g.20280 Transcript_14200/m.20280 type:complete len:190 (-) Transcript_14200:89-658(-)
MQPSLLLLFHVFLTIFVFSSCSQLVSSFGFSTNDVETRKVNFNRRNFVQASTNASLVALFPFLALPKVANAGVIGTGDSRCSSGVGKGCDQLSDDNEFIKQLQKKSAERKEISVKENLSAYQNKNYPDFFASLSPPRYMVKKSDGTFDLFTDVELTELRKAGKIKVEIPMAMGGKVTDLTQKPVLVLKD